jgi:hypothetical protein
VLPRGQVGLDPLLQGREAQVLQARHVRVRERLVGQIGQRWAAPEPERLAQLRGGGSGVGVGGLGDERLEAGEVELGWLDPEQIAGRARQEPSVAELVAQPRDVDLHALGHRRRRRAAPHLDEELRREDVVGVQQQHREQRSLLAPAERERAVAIDDLQRA